MDRLFKEDLLVLWNQVFLVHQTQFELVEVIDEQLTSIKEAKHLRHYHSCYSVLSDLLHVLDWDGFQVRS